MNIYDIILETIEDNVLHEDGKYNLVGTPVEMSLLLKKRLEGELGKTQAKLYKDLQYARTERNQEQQKSSALMSTVRELQNQISKHIKHE